MESNTKHKKKMTFTLSDNVIEILKKQKNMSGHISDLIIENYMQNEIKNQTMANLKLSEKLNYYRVQL